LSPRTIRERSPVLGHRSSKTPRRSSGSLAGSGPVAFGVRLPAAVRPTCPLPSSCPRRSRSTLSRLATHGPRRSLAVRVLELTTMMNTMSTRRWRRPLAAMGMGPPAHRDRAAQHRPRPGTPAWAARLQPANVQSTERRTATVRARDDQPPRPLPISVILSLSFLLGSQHNSEHTNKSLSSAPARLIPRSSHSYLPCPCGSRVSCPSASLTRRTSRKPWLGSS